MGEMIPNIGFSVMHQSIEVKPDSDGEERVMSVDTVLELDMKLYREEEHDLNSGCVLAFERMHSSGKRDVSGKPPGTE